MQPAKDLILASRRNQTTPGAQSRRAPTPLRYGIGLACAGLLFLTAVPIASQPPLNTNGNQNGARKPDSEFRQRSNILEGLSLDPIRFQPPAVTREDLSGGARLFTAADDSLPYVNLSFYFVGGTQAESLSAGAGSPAIGGPGSLEAALKLLETGGGGDRSGDELAATLAAMGAKLSFKSEYEFWSVTLTVLKKDFAVGLGLMEDVLLRPRLPQDRLQIIQNGMLAGIKRRNDDPARIAARKMNEALFAGSRRGYSLQTRDVNALNITALRADINRRLRPGGLYVAAAGDIADLNLKDRLNRLIDQFPSAKETRTISREAPNASAPLADQIRAKLRGRILLVNKPAAQAVIQIAGFLPARSSGDMYALQTGNYILGGGSFNSRLTREIRVRRGLAYYAYSYNDFDATIGRFVAGSGTRTFLAHKTLQLMLDTIKGMQTPVPATDLALAQDAILNSLAFQFDSPEDAAYHVFRNRLHGMPENYLANFPGRVRALSPADLSAVARKYLKTEDLLIVVAGPAALKEKLEAIRPVIVVEPEGQLRDLQLAGLP
ncbi:MAG: insulinase family protein [bacterium]|nr:insulinase family protein [bacterium]